jgi:hypothetical protein
MTEFNEAHSDAQCLNCGSVLRGPYCSKCGQRNIPRRQTLGELLINFISSFYSFESKFFATFRYLFVNPGFLAREYNAGKRERYFHPARAYVFTSFVFFLITFWNTPDDLQGGFTISEGDGKKPFVWGADSSQVRNNAYDSLIGYRSRKEYDSIQNTLPSDERDGFVKRYIEHKSIELNLKYRGQGDKLQSTMAQTYLGNFPKVFFLLLPVFALLLKLLYVRRDFFYSEHLVFSTSFYNFFFLVASVAILIGEIPYFGWLEKVLYLWIPVCLLIAMRVMYQQGWMKTLLKYVTLVSLFIVSIAMGLLLNLFVTLMQL